MVPHALSTVRFEDGTVVKKMPSVAVGSSSERESEDDESGSESGGAKTRVLIRSVDSDAGEMGVPDPVQSTLGVNKDLG